MKRSMLLIAGLCLAASIFSAALAEPVIRKTYRADGKCKGWIMQPPGSPLPGVEAGESVIEGAVTAQDKADLAALEAAGKMDKVFIVAVSLVSQIEAAKKIEATTANAVLRTKVAALRAKLEAQLQALTDSVK